MTTHCSSSSLSLLYFNKCLRCRKCKMYYLHCTWYPDVLGLIYSCLSCWVWFPDNIMLCSFGQWGCQTLVSSSVSAQQWGGCSRMILSWPGGQLACFFSGNTPKIHSRCTKWVARKLVDCDSDSKVVKYWSFWTGVRFVRPENKTQISFSKIAYCTFKLIPFDNYKPFKLIWACKALNIRCHGSKVDHHSSLFLQTDKGAWA